MSISVKNIAVTIGDAKSSGFDLSIDGEVWRLDDFTLHQGLLSYNILSFNLHKGPKENENEARFTLCSQIIGKEITLTLDTDNIENLSLNTNNEKTAEISFRGIIMSASGSRIGSQYIVNVEARSKEALLVNIVGTAYNDVFLSVKSEHVVAGCGHLQNVFLALR